MRFYSKIHLSFLNMQLLFTPLTFLLAEAVDTTSSSYKIGYQIGTWLPFAVLVGLFFLLIYFGRRRQQRQ